MIKPAEVRHRKRRRTEEPCDRDCVALFPGGLAGEKPMAVREWRGGGAWLGGSLEELQQFRNCFPFFCSLNCFPRSTVLSEAPKRRRLAGSTDGLLSFPLRPYPFDAKASAIRRTFRYYRFSADERSGNDGRADHRKKHPSLSSPHVPSSSYGKK